MKKVSFTVSRNHSIIMCGCIYATLNLLFCTVGMGHGVWRWECNSHLHVSSQINRLFYNHYIILLLQDQKIHYRELVSCVNLYACTHTSMQMHCYKNDFHQM